MTENKKRQSTTHGFKNFKTQKIKQFLVLYVDDIIFNTFPARKKSLEKKNTQNLFDIRKRLSEKLKKQRNYI